MGNEELAAPLLIQHDMRHSKKTRCTAMHGTTTRAMALMKHMARCHGGQKLQRSIPTKKTRRRNAGSSLWHDQGFFCHPECHSENPASDFDPPPHRCVALRHSK